MANRTSLGPTCHPAQGHASGTTLGPACHPAQGYDSGTTLGPACHLAQEYASGTTLGPAYQGTVDPNAWLKLPPPNKELNPIHNMRKMFSQATRESIEKSVTFYGANLVRALALVATMPSTMEKKTQSSHNRMETMSYSFTLLLI